MKSVHVFLNKYLTDILGIRLPATISNVDLSRSTKKESVEITIRTRRSNKIGHTLQKENKHITKQALERNPQCNESVEGQNIPGVEY